MREVSYGYCISSMSFQSEKYPNWSGIPTFLFLDLLCNIGLSVSGLRKIRFNAYTPVEFPQKNQFPKKQGFPLSTLIILDWYLKLLILDLFPDLFWNIGLSVSGLRKIRFNAYTPRRISTKKSVPKETRIPIVHVNNFRLVSKIINFRFVPWFIVKCRFECQRFTKNTFQRLYTQSNFNKTSVPKQTRIPIVRVDNFRLVSLYFSVPWFIV